MHMIFSNFHLRFVKRLLFLLIPYSILRIGFYFYHYNIYKQFSLSEVSESLLLGIRFDLAALCLLNIPVIFLSLIPSNHPKFLKFERFVFIIVNSIGFLSTIDDYELFLFNGKRLSYDFFVITDDILDQLPQITAYYWYLPLLALLFCMLFFFLDKKFFGVREERSSWKHAIGGVLLAGLTFVGIRGGLQYKSINVQSAFVQGKNELGHLVLNTPYHFLRTLKTKTISKVTYFASDEKAKEHIRASRTVDDFPGIPKANVVLIILESFAMEYMEKGYTPFLSELRYNSLFFNRNLANGRRSIEALPSILCGLPSLLNEPISKSSFQSNKFECFPKILKEAGYETHFYHAGARGTMGFESFSLANGVDHYHSKEDYPHQGHFDGTWGIFDGPYLEYMSDQIDKMKSPFFAGVFTLSSHQPYAIPKEMKGKFKKGTLEIHESIQYTDYALKKFFEKVRAKPWFKNTLFIITSDHTQKLETKKYLNTIGHYRVPLILYASGMRWPNLAEKVTQHADIPHTVLDFVNLKSDRIAGMGMSVFAAGQGRALNFGDGTHYFMLQDETLEIKEKKGRSLKATYNWTTGEVTESLPSQDKLLMAYMQYFINGLINNNLSLYR